MLNEKRSLILLFILVVLAIGLNVTYAEDVDAQHVTNEIQQDNSYDTPDANTFQRNINNDNISKKNYNEISKRDDEEIRYVYVNSSGNSTSDGHDYSNPTTFENAWNTVEDSNIILLLGDNNTVYNITNNIKTTNLKSTVRNVTIKANNSNVILNFFSSNKLEITSKYYINIENINFIRNYESDIPIIQNNANLTLTNCSFKDINSSFEKGVIYNNNTLTLNKCEFINNNAPKGIIYNENANIYMSNCFFEDNVAVEGVLSALRSNVRIMNSSFYRNNASFGGVFLIRDNSSLSVNKSSFINNSAMYYGGVINSWYSSCLFDNSIFINNSADVGAIVYSAKNTQIKIINSLLENNSANIANNVYSFADALIINNNALINPDNRNSIYCYNTSYNLDKNWWGINNPNFSLLTNNLLPNNWRLMIVNSEFDNVTYKISVAINQLTNGTVLNEKLFNRTVSFTTNEGNLIYEKSNIDSNVTNDFMGDLTDLIVKIDNQTMRVDEKIIPYLSISNVTAIIGKNTSIFIRCNPDITDNININVNNTPLITSKADNGILDIEYLFNDTWTPGNYVLSASITNNSKYSDTIINSYLLLKNNEEPIVNIVTKNVENNVENIAINSQLNLDTAKLFQTSVKDQGNSGSCWAFSALSTLESAYLKVYNMTFNFSENNMKNVLKRYSIIGDQQTSPNTGNNELEPISYLVGWYGPIDENTDSYDEYSIMSPILNNSIKVEDVYFYYRTSYVGNDNMLLKEAITKYGALASSIYASYPGSSAKRLYKTDTPYADHAISIVGWDNFYSKDDFYGFNKPQSNGAYIIKNSWGESIGDNGYQYVSYYDTSLAGVNLNNYKTSFSYAFPLNEYENYTNIYQHDTVSNILKYLTPSAWIRNVYTAKYDESVAGIGTFIYEDCDYEAYIYVNDNLCYSQEGNITQEGFRIIKLNKYVSVKEGDVFRVDLKLKAHEGSYTMITLQDTTKYKSLSNEKQSFISSDGENWNDLYYDEEYPGSCACLKVYTKEVPTIKSNISKQLDNYVITTHVNNLKNPGRLCYRIDDSYYVNGEDDIVYIPISEDGIYTITLNPNNTNYKYNLTVNLEIDNYEISEIFELGNPLEINIFSTNYSYQLDELQEINALLKITNNNNSPVNNGKVYLFENTTLVDECDVINGSVKFIINKNIGEYEYTLVYNSSEEFNCENVTVTLIILKNDVYITINDIENSFIYDKINITGTIKTGTMNNIEGPAVLNINGYNYALFAINGTFNYEYEINTTGINNISIYYDGNDIYSTSYSNKTFIVNKISTRITINPIYHAVVNSTIKINGTIIGVDRPLEIDKINITLNNIIREVTVNSTGYYESSFNLTQIGTNNVTVSYVGNQKYEGSLNQISFDVMKINTVITSDIAVDTLNDNIIITGTLKDENNNTIANEEIVIEINDEIHSSNTNSNGMFNYTKTIDVIGLNNISFYFEGNYYYNSTHVNKTFTIPKKNVTLTVDVEKTKYRDNITIYGKLTDEKNNEMKNETVIISINTAEYNTTTNNEGKYVLITPAINVGMTNISVTYPGNNLYNPHRINTTTNIDKQDILLTFNEIKSIKYLENVTITGKFTDIHGKEFRNWNVFVYINGKKYKTTTDSTATYTLTTPANTMGTNNVTITYPGNNHYNNYEINTTFNVDKQDILITYNPIQDTKYRENVTITGTLVDHNNNALANSIVRLLVNNGRKTLKTDANGVYTFDYTFTRIGENTITATYEGSDFYNEATESITVEVKPLATTIVIDPMNPVAKGTKATITGTLTDENGDAVAYAAVKLSINGSNKTLKTGANGKFTHTYTMNKIGETNITAEFAGNANYEATETATTLEVTKAEAVITLNPVENAVKGNNVTFTGKLTNARGVAIANAQVKIMINGSPKTLKTDSKGLFTHTFKMTKEGTNNITAIFNGNNNYQATETNTTFQVIEKTG